MKVEVPYFSRCPNHPPAVDRVRGVLAQEGTPAEMIEVEVQDAAAAANGVPRFTDDSR